MKTDPHGLFIKKKKKIKTALKVTEPADLLETSRGPETRQREGALEVSVFLIAPGACYSAGPVRKNTRGFPGFYQPGRESEFSGCLPVVQHSTAQHSTAQCSAVQCSAVQ